MKKITANVPNLILSFIVLWSCLPAHNANASGNPIVTCDSFMTAPSETYPRFFLELTEAAPLSSANQYTAELFDRRNGPSAPMTPVFSLTMTDTLPAPTAKLQHLFQGNLGQLLDIHLAVLNVGTEGKFVSNFVSIDLETYEPYLIKMNCTLYNQ